MAASVGPYLCRDCLRDGPVPSGARPRCPHCGSPRGLHHPERDALGVAHIDCDAFYAAVEKRENPDLADKPVIIGGGRRGVVATACYVARIYGVRSAMPMFKALEACPDAVVIRPRMALYVEVGRRIREMMRELTPLVEPISIDEAFLDLGGTERLHGASPAVILARFAARVEREVGVSISVGLSYSKFLAKIASDRDKPRGFSIIGREEAVGFLAGQPVGILPGIGKVAQERLARAGIRLIGDVARRPLPELMRVAGNDAARLLAFARGEDSRPVKPEREAKSVSAETTFDEDIAARENLEPVLWRLSEKVARRLKASGVAGRAVTLKLKTADFRLRTRSVSGLAPTQLAGRLYAAALPLLAAECDGSAFRLIGIGASDLTEAAAADLGDLADTGVAREKSRESAIDRLRERFGDDIVSRGLALRDKK
ncbi:MAG: DNA polymerase IV [Salinarimonadaceae bacterium]|nr:MAG: DNA polymerase IV [Salinarimonadaceae bacterium]